MRSLCLVFSNLRTVYCLRASKGIATASCYTLRATAGLFFPTGTHGDTTTQCCQRSLSLKVLKLPAEYGSRINNGSKYSLNAPQWARIAFQFPHHTTSMLTAAAFALGPGLQAPHPLCSSVEDPAKLSRLVEGPLYVKMYIPDSVWRIVYALKWLLKWYLEESGLESMQ